MPPNPLQLRSVDGVADRRPTPTRGRWLRFSKASSRPSNDEALCIADTRHPAIKAAEADVEAASASAMYAKRATTIAAAPA
jgi:outer membrane protein TolC